MMMGRIFMRERIKKGEEIVMRQIQRILIKRNHKVYM